MQPTKTVEQFDRRAVALIQRGRWLKLSNGQIRKLESIHETFLKEKELNALRAQFQEKAMESPLEGRKVLTPEQRAHVTAFFIGRGFGLHHGMEWMGSVYPLG